MLAYISQFFNLVYFSPEGLFIVSYICSLFCFRCFFCNKFEIWRLYQSSAVNTIKLHNSTTNNNFEKKKLFQTCIIVQRTCIAIFSRIGLVDQSKPCTQIYLQKIAYCTNMQLAIQISKNHACRTCTTP